MKNIIKLSFFLALSISTISCSEDFLDLQPQQNISNDNFLTTFDDFQTAVLGLHDQLQGGGNAALYGRYTLLVPDVMGEDVKQNASANRAKEWAEYNGSETDFIPEDIWEEFYEAINIANSVINSDFDPGAELTADFNTLKGQAYGIRGLAYFMLSNFYAQPYSFSAGAGHLGVPIVTEFDFQNKPSRSTVAEVYAQVIADLNQATTLITGTQKNAGYFSKAAAEAILSRVYLYMEDWTNAESKATSVINNYGYTLVSRDAYPTQFIDGLSSEAIFEMIYNQTDNTGSNHIGGMYKITGYGDYLPSNDWYALMEDGDIRRTMITTDSNLIGDFAKLPLGPARVDKWPSEGPLNGTDNVSIIRLSEVILNRAEARTNLGNDAGAQADVDLIRQRANPGVAAVTATGAALKTEVYNERRAELAFEGHRIFDINRRKQNLARVLDCTSVPEACNLSYPNNLFILPIPDGETNSNENITQNPGY